MDLGFMLGVFNLIQIVVHQASHLLCVDVSSPCQTLPTICVHTLSKNGLITNFNVPGYVTIGISTRASMLCQYKPIPFTQLRLLQK